MEIWVLYMNRQWNEVPLTPIRYHEMPDALLIPNPSTVIPTCKPKKLLSSFGPTQELIYSVSSAGPLVVTSQCAEHHPFDRGPSGGKSHPCFRLGQDRAVDAGVTRGKKQIKLGSVPHLIIGSPNSPPQDVIVHPRNVKFIFVLNFQSWSYK